MVCPPYIAVTLKVVPAAPDPSSTHTVAKATVLAPPALTIMGLLNDDDPNTATAGFVLLNVTFPVDDDDEEDVIVSAVALEAACAKV